jgi:hypothetical protein
MAAVISVVLSNTEWIWGEFIPSIFQISAQKQKQRLEGLREEQCSTARHQRNSSCPLGI